MEYESWRLDLAMDRVLSLGQIRRRYLPSTSEAAVRVQVIRLAAAGHLVAWSEWVPLTARARVVRFVTFVGLTRVAVVPAALRHLCGVAEMRWRLRHVVHAWDASDAAVLQEGAQPDALAEDRHGCLAVEYDAGAYSAEQVLRKTQTFRALYGRQVWGAPHRARQQWLRTHLPSGVDVLLAPWWS